MNVRIPASIEVSPKPAIKHFHVFSFGDVKKPAEWLEERGSWDIKTSLYPSTASNS